MGEVIDINANTPHWQGPVTCSACGHAWRAVAPVGTHVLECPKCQKMAGVEYGSRELALIRALEKIATGRAPNESSATNLEIVRSIATDALDAAGWPVK